MSYSWPVTDPELQEALDIALNYLKGSGQAEPFEQTERICGDAILAAWNEGERRQIQLVNHAIVATEH
jgi:hypothetical protein